MEKIMKHHLSYKDQLLLFKQRGMNGINQNNSHFVKQVHTLSIIGYYKLKQYAYIFWNNNLKQYKKISFDELVKRYYREQALKHEIFQAIGDIEAALNNEIAYVLGKDDPELYLNFEKWCQNRGRNKYLGTIISRRKKIGVKVDKYKIKKEELAFLSQLQRQVRKSNYLDIQKFEINNVNKVFPSVWLMVNTLTFGQSIYLVKLMSPRNREIISKKFFHYKTKKLIKDLELLNLIRNICCHNGDLADISLKTMPKISERYKPYLNMTNDNYPHRLAIVVTVLLGLMYSLNKKYDFSHLNNRLVSMCKLNGNNDGNELARSLGFKDKASITKMIKSFKQNRVIIFYPNGDYIYCEV